MTGGPAAIICLALVACSATPAHPTEGPLSSSQMPEGPFAVASPDASGPTARIQSQQAWGPLAVIDASVSGGDWGGIAGTLDISDMCVTVDDLGPKTLIWPSGQTTWSPDHQAIAYDDVLSGTRQELRDGTQALFGGNELTEEPSWLAKPDPSCPGEYWVVTNIVSNPGS